MSISDIASEIVIPSTVIIAAFLGVVTIVVYAISVYRISRIENEIHAKNFEKMLLSNLVTDEELMRLSAVGDREGYDRRFKMLEDNCQFSIDRLERRRRFILDKLPFLKK